MKEKLPFDGRELICINVDKVYDWVTKEMNFEHAVSPYEKIEFYPKDSVPNGEIKGATVTCDVSPDDYCPVEILGRDDRPVSIDGRNILLQQLHIRKNFEIRICLTLADGTVLRSEAIKVSRCERVTLCAPEGTNVEVTYTDLDCFVCTTGHIYGDSTGSDRGTIKFKNLTITVSTCQSIQSTFPVTVEFLADYCDPRADLPFACPGPVRPHHCSTIFPDSDNCNG